MPAGTGGPPPPTPSGYANDRIELSESFKSQATDTTVPAGYNSDTRRIESVSTDDMRPEHADAHAGQGGVHEHGEIDIGIGEGGSRVLERAVPLTLFKAARGMMVKYWTTLSEMMSNGVSAGEQDQEDREQEDEA